MKVLLFELAFSQSPPDVDECALGTDQCAQDCTNTVGSYTCNCRTGYRLNPDGRRCDGKQNFFKSFTLMLMLMLLFRY